MLRHGRAGPRFSQCWGAGMRRERFRNPAQPSGAIGNQALYRSREIWFANTINFPGK
jgi:hypothetical protein